MNLQDMFSVANLTAAVNKLPAIPGKVGAMGLFDEKGVTSTSVVIDEREGRLVLVPNTSRNDDPAPMKGSKRKRRTFETLHLPLNRPILPSQLQGVAAFGQEDATAPVATVINDNLQELKNSIEATCEFQRVGALRGKLLDADGEVISDLFKEFEVSQKKITVALSNAGTNVRKACLDAKRFSESKLGGVMVTGFRALCGPDWFDAMIDHEKVKAAFANYQEAQDRLGGDVRSGFTFGGIEFIEYDVTVSGQRFIPADIAQVFPVARGVFRMFNAPANYNETVNTIGQPFYSKAEERKLGKGWDLEAQANPLAMCLFPEALVELKAG
ncbi:major capsid protein [Pseudomonas fluorescens]|uniref:Major capsid protein n=2 Tax=Pseudomonas TaxID=286 RepID=A0A944HEP6_PSEFL|nr:major capsid protein [Pseudomonas fluorescens]MBT2294548.1 major capsid protein [Pseudomonas fluorescens]MBT2306796.1 major capsid protein [Pseudomonas fluorescens]MBT2316294.1 major capsid protein [Pseudomonas fluorescens]MBT2331631.1 major capsid protein [Pseudomonas fluorescens]MBT2342799.1 major capsid protein [Pseudomonas fluorescens]